MRNGEWLMTKEKAQTKKIHVDLPEEVHQRVRVKAALEDVSMQALVARIVTEAVADVVLPTIKENKRRG
jgi:predicted HicB family RNase H-like nuclease